MLAEMLRRLCRNSDGTAVVEFAIATPLFMVLTLGIIDLGIGISTRMAINAATQSGATSAIANSSGLCAFGPNPPLPAQPSLACYQAIFEAMNEAAGTQFCNTDPKNCNDSYGQLCNTDPNTLMTSNNCTASIGGQGVCQRAGDPNPPASAECVIVTATYVYKPLLLDPVYSWAGLTAIVSQATARFV